MQLLDIKNDLAKLVYEPSKNPLMLADFLLIEDENQSLLAQVIGIEASSTENANLAVIKFIISIDKNAKMMSYNGYIPAKNAQIIIINPKEISLLFKNSDKTVYFGNLANHLDTGISLDIKILENNFYCQVDNLQNSITFTKNLITELSRYNKQIVIIDFDGRYKDFNANRITISKEFKLPLSFEAFDYIIQYDLEGSTENKAIIQSILIEIQNYVQTIKEDFLPFNDFMNVINSQFNEYKNSEMAIFRNKILKYAQQGLFAQTTQQFELINKNISQKLPLIIDLSYINENWHKFALKTLIKLINQKCYLIAHINDVCADKQTIKALYETQYLKPIIFSCFNYKLSREIKIRAKNLALFLPIENINDFGCYTSFLNKLNADEFIIWGQNTHYIPLILKLALIPDIISDRISNEIEKDVDNLLITKPKEIEQQKQVEISKQENREVEQTTDFQENPELEIIEDLDDEFEKEIQNEEQEFELPDLTEEDLDFVEISNIDENTIENTDFEEEIEIIKDASQEVINETLFENDDETAEELEENNINEDIDENDEKEPEINNENDFSQEELEDIFNNETGIKTEQIQEFSVESENDKIKPKNTIKPDDVLQIKSSTQTPVNEDEFQIGQYVESPKYGKGQIENIISYGAKKLCSIQFENVGRRLLEPKKSGIKKI